MNINDLMTPLQRHYKKEILLLLFEAMLNKRLFQLLILKALKGRLNEQSSR